MISHSFQKAAKLMGSAPSKLLHSTKCSTSTSTSTSTGTRNASSRATGFVALEKNSSSLRRLSSMYADADEYEDNEEGCCDHESPTTCSHLSYISDFEMPITSMLHITTPTEDIPSGTWPVFRIMVRSHLKSCLFIISNDGTYILLMIANEC